MSILIQKLPTNLGINLNADYLIVDQGTPPITRRATVAQFRAANSNSTGQVGVVPSRKYGQHLSELPLASAVYLNDTLIVDQGTPPITRRVTVAQIQAIAGMGPANTELVSTPTNLSISQLPAANVAFYDDYTIINQGQPPVTRHIKVLDLFGIQASFTFTPQSGAIPLSVTFTDTSTPQSLVTAWAWDFGDGGTSALQNPSHTFVSGGSFTVKLTITALGTTFSFTGTVNALVCDIYYNSVYLLNHFEGTNGSTVVVDSSKYGRSGTMNNCSISTSAPLVGGGSAVLTSAGNNRITYNSNQSPNPNFIFSGDHTIEVTFRQTALGTGTRGLWCNYCTIGTDVHNGIQFIIGTSGNIQCILYNEGAIAYNTGTSPTAATANVRHTATVSRIGNNVYLLLDGILQTTTTASGGMGADLYDVTEGRDPGASGAGNVADRDFNGKLDEIRVTMGVGRYSANYTVMLPYPDSACS